MQARLTAFVPDSAAITRSLSPGERLRIGRGDDCELLLAHPSISRLHAELVVSGDRWRLTDLRSKNGSFVEGAQVASTLLESSCWLRFGDVHCEFAALDAAARSEEHTSELQSLMRISYAVFCLKKKKEIRQPNH